MLPLGFFVVWCGAGRRGFRNQVAVGRMARSFILRGGDPLGEEVLKCFHPPSTSGRDAPHEWSMGILDEPGENLLDLFEGGEVVDAVRALPEFAGSLRSPEEEDGEDRAFTVPEAENMFEAVLVLGGAAAHHFLDEVLFGKRAESLQDIGGVKIGNGISAGALIAGSDQGVEGKWIGIRGEDLLFEKAAQDTGFLKGELDFGKVLHGSDV